MGHENSENIPDSHEGTGQEFVNRRTLPVAILLSVIMTSCGPGNDISGEDLTQADSSSSFTNPFETLSQEEEIPAVDAYEQQSTQTNTTYREATSQEIIAKRCDSGEPLISRTLGTDPEGTLYGDTVCRNDD